MFKTANQQWFVDLLKQVEGKGGFDGQLWRPFSSSEGGKATIGFGHKLNHPVVFLNGKEIDVRFEPLTTEQVNQLLVQDISAAEERARAEYTRFKTPAGQRWADLAPLHQSMFTEIVFNIGTLKKGAEDKFSWVKLANGMKFGNDKAVFEELGRTFTDEDGNVTQLTSRVNALKKAYKQVPKQEVESNTPDFQGDKHLETIFNLTEAIKEPTPLAESTTGFEVFDEDMLRRIRADNADLFKKAETKTETKTSPIQKTEKDNGVEVNPADPNPIGFSFEEGIFKQNGSMFEVIKVK